MAASFVLHDRARTYHYSGAGPLSIKSFYQGRALYRLSANNARAGGHAAVDDGSYLVLNHDQPYSLAIDSETPVESFCVFFALGLAEDVYRSLARQPEALLDDPLAPGAPLGFYDRTYPHNRTLTPALHALRAAVPAHRDDPAWLNEQLHHLAEQLLHVHQAVRVEVAALPAVRAATREELYRRLHRARDYAAAYFDQPLTLDDLARVAALSPNHLLRTFRQAFGQTPHQYLTELRLERARALLAQTDQPVTAICLAVGFESPGSFSTLFRRRYGLAPSQLRAAATR
jgi:AraC family transcriptional regulator